MSPEPFIEVRFAARRPWVPSRAAFKRWISAAVPGAKAVAVSVNVVGEKASRTLNARYRGKDKPTNVLSFAGAGVSPDGRHWLGEIVICAPVLAREARMQHKTAAAHWAHITIHGVLHLQGYDHLKGGEARRMEAVETQILEKMGFSNPYGRF